MANVELEKARVRLYQKSDRRQAIIALSSVLLVLFGFVGFLNLINSVNLGFRGDQTPAERFIYWLVLGTLGFIGPYGYFLAKKQREIKLIERRLPDFLRDVAEAGRFGMTLAEAIVVSSGGRYGKLTPEIKKMAAQISWGVPATEALRLFSERVKTPMVQRYIAVIYISFMVFLVTIWILNVTFLPKMLEASNALGQTGTAVASPLATDLVGVVRSIRLAFFIAIIVHGLGDGILAGVLDTGSIPNGLRHSFVMLLIGFCAFLII